VVVAEILDGLRAHDLVVMSGAGHRVTDALCECCPSGRIVADSRVCL